jgi:hypothetical protein
VVVHDRVNALDPRAMGIGGYDVKLQPQIKSIPALKQWFLHTPESPQLTSGSAEWHLPSGARVQLAMLLPKNASAIVENEKFVWPANVEGAGWIDDSEKKWHIRVTPPTDQKWDTFLNVVQVYDGAAYDATLVRSAGGEAEGVLVERPEGEDVLLLFNGLPAPDIPDGSAGWKPEVQSMLRIAHFRRNGFDVLFKAKKTTRVYVFDLHYSVAWTLQIDGGPALPLEESPAGVAQVTVAGAGQHRLILGGSGPSSPGQPGRPPYPTPPGPRPTPTPYPRRQMP